ncbi:unnamed protein product [Trichobilharzia szidati]|nr:unnamed protein product [Trichobilharzia szidati]
MQRDGCGFLKGHVKQESVLEKSMKTFGMETERSNLLAVAKIVVRDLIQYTYGRQQVSFDETFFSIIPGNVPNGEVSNIIWLLLCVIEHCLCHGLRHEYTTTNSAYSTREGTMAKEFLRNTTSVIRRACDHVTSTANSFVKQSSYPNPWPVLLEVEKLSAFSNVISSTIVTMTEIKTGIGLSRVWLRQALMRKQLGEYIQVIIDYIGTHSSDYKSEDSSKDCESKSISNAAQKFNLFTTFYEPGALLLNNEGIVLTGLLASLKSIDFCFILKDNLSYMDRPLQPIPYHIYLQYNLDKLEKLYSKVNLISQVDLSVSIEQKNFLEDLCNALKKRIDRENATNRKLNMELADLSKQMESMKLENQSLSIAVAQLKRDKIGLTTLQSENVDSQSSLEHKQTVIKQLEAKSKGMTSIIEQMKERISNLSNDKVSQERDLSILREQLSNLEMKYDEQSRVIENQANQIESLKGELHQKTTQLNELKVTAEELPVCKSNIEELTKQLTKWRKRCEEQECSLTEMAEIVNSTKLEAESLRESHNAFKDAQWANDSENPNCFLCQSAFSVSRRRHHCRNCGLIFCHECSSRKMTLPSSSKPVRVCDTCHALLLHRYNAK